MKGRTTVNFPEIGADQAVVVLLPTGAAGITITVAAVRLRTDQEPNIFKVIGPPSGLPAGFCPTAWVSVDSL